MGLRLGTGPVFAWEWLRTARRWQLYAARAAFVSILLAGLTFVWAEDVAGRIISFQQLARVGATFFIVIVFMQLAVVMFVAPAMTAGAICMEKARGTLSHLLVTDLSAAEIVLGKLAARLIPIVGLIACSLPIVAITTLLGGVDPVILTGTYFVTLGAAVLAAALALVFSVWGTKVHEVLVTTYLVLIGWFLSPFVYLVVREMIRGGPSLLPVWMAVIHPVALIIIPIDRVAAGPYAFIGFDDQAAFLVGCLGLSVILAVVAMARVRAVAARHGPGPGASRRPIWWRVAAWSVRLPTKVWPISALIRLRDSLRINPTLDGNPVLWREWHRQRPTRWGRAIRGVYLAGALGFSLLAIATALIKGRDEEFGGFVNGFQVAIGLLILLTTAVTSLAEERARGSLDVLLTTTLTTREVVWGKWLASFRFVPSLAVLAGVVSLLTAEDDLRMLVGPPLVLALVLAQGAAVVSLGLWLSVKLPNLGRALGWSVGVFVLATVAWPIVAIGIFEDHEAFGIGLGMASPFLGPCCATLMTSGEGPDRQMAAIYLWALAWIIAGFGFSALLVRRTLRSFNAHLGRVGDVEVGRLAALFGDVDVRFRIGDYRISISNVGDVSADHRAEAEGRGRHREQPEIRPPEWGPEPLAGSGSRTP